MAHETIDPVERVSTRNTREDAMNQERFEQLEKKFAPLELTFDLAEIAHVRCLKCSKELDGDDGDGNEFYCAPCLLNTDAEVLEDGKVREVLCLYRKMALLGVMTDKLLPNPEFGEFIREYKKRDFESTGISKHLGFKNPDMTNFIRFLVEL